MNLCLPRFRSLLSVLLLAWPLTARPHCDTLEGPVVAAARAALNRGDVTPVLMWVQPDDEAAVQAAFARTLVVRRQSPEAAALADTWFFETLVRLHRAGEGAPYTGLKSGAPEEPGIAAADRALASGESADLLAATVEPLHALLAAKLAAVRERQRHASDSVAAGRAYVAAYVDYVHFAERLATLARSAPADANAHASHAH